VLLIDGWETKKTLLHCPAHHGIKGVGLRITRKLSVFFS